VVSHAVAERDAEKDLEAAHWQMVSDEKRSVRIVWFFQKGEAEINAGEKSRFKSNRVLYGIC